MGAAASFHFHFLVLNPLQHPPGLWLMPAEIICFQFPLVP